MVKLSTEEIEARLESCSEWERTGDKLQRTFGFDDFLGSMAFVRQVAELAERQQHHPDILIRYGKVTLTVSTHDAGGITVKDFELITAVDKLAAPAEGRAVEQ